MVQLHKKFTDAQVKELVERYIRKEIDRNYIQEILGIGQTRFFALVKSYRQNPQAFTVQYQRHCGNRELDPKIEKNILKELSVEKKLILNKETTIRFYNYSYIKDCLEQDYKQKVSLPTIIDRAKTYGFYMKKPKRKTHDREVLTRYTGELIQHDSSFHLWSPASNERWHLITSLDDFSRMILYAKLVKTETTWSHIMALQTVFLQYGLPFSYYVDSHAIFRFVQSRDSLWYKHHRMTDEIDPQWKQVLRDCNVKVIYALSPQAKGKIERPYQWLQDRLVRTCVRNNVTQIQPAQTFLNQEIQRYNFRQVHSTTGEVPFFRFQRAIKEKRSLFRSFKLVPPYQSPKDIFCLRIDRTVDDYRKISIHTIQLKVNHVNPGDVLNLRMAPLDRELCELRFWRKDQLIDIQRVKISELKGVHF
jgi:hypothetical protein